MKRLLTIAIGILCPMLSHSHHNSAPIYDHEASTTVEGTVIEFRFANPHARVYFDVSDDNGNVERWMAEGNSLAALRRRGWTGEEMKPGDRVRIAGAPSRDGSRLIAWHTITLPDGTELGGGNRSEPEREELFERLERLRRAARPDND